MIKNDQDTQKAKKGNKNDVLSQKANKQNQSKTEVETQQVVGCKVRFLVGYENERTFATITTTKKRSRLSILVPRKELSCQRIQTHQG